MTRSAAVGGAGRVIAGSARGLRLTAPGSMTRPFADRVKQAVFAILEPDIRDAHVLDLFAGSGAAGIEALSRGAATAVFVERDRAAASTIRENLLRARFGADRTRVVQADVIDWLGTPDAAVGGPFGIVVLDPPYDQPSLLRSALERIGEPPNALAPGAIVLAKHSWRDAPPDRIGLLASSRARRFGETALTFYRAVGPTEDVA